MSQFTSQSATAVHGLSLDTARLIIRANAFTLTVTASEEAGNTATATATPVFKQEREDGGN